MADRELAVKDEKSGATYQEHAREDESADAVLYRKKEAALVRKLDWYIAPVLMLTQLISYLDRGNIGFAATQGMIEDIHLRGSDLNTAVSVFYVFYILAEFPTAILVKRLQFNRVLPTAVFCWGVVCLGQGFVRDFGGLVACRIFLGFFEGCLFPTLTLLMCNWYKREELGLRIAYIFIAGALSGAFGGLIAWAILYMDGVAGYAGWRWLYIIEGLTTVVWAAMCIFLTPKDFETAYFLNDEDKMIMRQRAVVMESYSGGTGHYTKSNVKTAAKDVKSWLHGFIQIACVTIVYGFGTFLPIFIKNGFHFSTVQAQYLVIPVSIWGSLVYAVGAWLSDRYRSRFLPLMICCPFGIAGYAILLTKQRPGVQYFATYLVSTACYICTGGNLAWLAANCAPDGKRAASVGIATTLLNIGGVISGQIYQTKAAPAYTLGHAWSMGSLCFAWCMWWVVRHLYKRREAWNDKATSEGYVVQPGEHTDRSPDFRYQQ